METSAEKNREARAPVVFYVFAGLLAAAVLSIYLWIISVEWFQADDFYFLREAQKPWDWGRVLFPGERDLWWPYRPLGVEAFFHVAFRLFGWNAPGYYALSAAAYLGTAFLVYRIAGQLGYDVRIGVVAALLSVSRLPGIYNVPVASCFHYAGATLLHTLSLTLFLDYLRTRRIGLQAGALLAFTLALFCNEYTLTLPPVLLLASLLNDSEGRGSRSFFRWAALRSALLRTVPYLLPAGGFLWLRQLAIGAVERPRFYSLEIDPYYLHKVVANLAFVPGERFSLYAMLALMAAVVTLVVRQQGFRGEAASRLWREQLLWVPWTLATLLPVSLLLFPVERLAIPLQVPVTLWFCSFLNALWRAYGQRFPRLSSAAMLVLVPLSLPLTAASVRMVHPTGPVVREFLDTLARQHPELDDRAVVTILYGGEGRGDELTANWFRGANFKGVSVSAVYPHKHTRMVFHDVTRTRRRKVLCKRCVYFNLLSDRTVEPVSAQELRHWKRWR
jgi:hypothetical protein